MRPRDVVGLGLVALVAPAPSYFVERLTEYYFLSGNSTLFVWSSFRTPLFITLVLMAVVESGHVVKDIKAAVDSAVPSVTFSYCSPRRRACAPW
jgi:hypothetical protein